LTFSRVALQAPVRLTLEEAKSRAQKASPAILAARLGVEEKTFHKRSVISQFFPKVNGIFTYLHYSQPLGTILTGPRGNPIQIAIMDQDQVIAGVTATEPITPLFALWMLLDISRADENIARAKVEEAPAETDLQVEKLFLSLLIAERELDAAKAAMTGTPRNIEEHRARMDALKKNYALDAKVAELTEQLDGMTGHPPSTPLELVAPTSPLPAKPTLDEALARALQHHGELREADETVAKAEAATRLSKLEFGPEVAAVGGWAYQRVLPVVPNNFGFVGVVGSWTLLDFGKTYHELREREAQRSQARLGQRVARAKLEGEVPGASRD
jgi:outer membrane protein TolC